MMDRRIAISPATPGPNDSWHFMKKPIMISTLFFLTLSSCDNPRTQDKQKQETPKALEENRSAFDRISKRSDGDIVDALYFELVEKTPN
jgi:hypothetical protein